VLFNKLDIGGVLGKKVVCDRLGINNKKLTVLGHLKEKYHKWIFYWIRTNDLSRLFNKIIRNYLLDN
jgi:hypothetical protein